jgi:hypothetical protein
MATTSGEGPDPRRLVMPVVTYAIVLALIGGVGFILWTGGKSGPQGPGAISKAAQIEPFQAGRGLGLPAHTPESRPAAAIKKNPEEARVVVSSPSSSEPSNSDVAASAAPTKKEPTQEPASPALSQSETSNSDAAAATTIQPEPPKNTCTAGVGSWPIDSTDQVKAIQILMRDLGLYGGTTYGTLGPATRAAIRKFQLTAEHAETGEPSEMLFEALKRKCASSAP